MAGRNLNLKRIYSLIDAAKENLPVEQQFLNDLTATIERGDSGRLPSKTYKPSSMGCPRQMVYQVLGYPVDKGRASFELIGMGESGTDRHERLQGHICRMKEMGIDCEYISVPEYLALNNIPDVQVVAQTGFETKLKHTVLNMSFMCDGIIRYKNKYFILEIKTELSAKWNSRTGVAEDHLAQASAYSYSLKIDDVLFIYENRDLLSIKPYLLQVTDEMRFRHVLSKIEYCDSYAKRLKIPPKPGDIPEKVCGYCGYRTQCNRDLAIEA